MAGLEPTVHVQLDSWLQSFSDAERVFQIYDTIDAKESVQTRTILIPGKRFIGQDFYFCGQSTVDYTKYVNQETEYEFAFQTFHLPVDVIKSLLADYLPKLESEAKEYREQFIDDDIYSSSLDLMYEEDES